MAHTDYEVGRVVQRVQDLGLEENTLVILMIGDNGASGEGTSFDLPYGWDDGMRALGGDEKLSKDCDVDA